MIEACRRPGVSIAAIALANGLNANMLRKWVIDAEGSNPTATTEHHQIVAGAGAQFIALAPPATNAGAPAGDPDRGAAGRDGGQGELAKRSSSRVRRLAARVAAVIRIDAVWLAVEPLDMRAGTETALARVVKVFGEARAHHAYLFANRRANRMKVLVHDGIGIWLCARRLHQGRFIWAESHSGTRLDSRTSSCAH